MARNPAIPVDEMDEFLNRKRLAKEAAKAPASTDGEFTIIMEPEGLYRVEHASGRGVLPVILQGKFTSIGKVHRIIEHYKATK